MDQLTAAHIVDIAVLGVVLLFGIAGFWRGVAKETIISAGLLLGYTLTLNWSARWGEWIGERTSLSIGGAMFAVLTATVLLSCVVIGYVGGTIAGLPPADAPGRVGGLIVGAANAVFVIALILGWAEGLILSDDRIATLRESVVASRLSEHPDRVLLAVAVLAVAIVVVAWQVRRRRLLIGAAASPPRQGEGRFSFRRPAPLAPEAEKLERETASASNWTVPATYAETTPLTRASDPSAWTDRPATDTRRGDTNPALWRSDEAVRCTACGERIGDSDRYCPRCGRQLT